MRYPLKTALKHSKLFQPTLEPGTWLIPGFFPDLHWCEKLPAAGGLPPGQSFKSPYLSQRAAFVLLWREGDPDRWPVFSRLERMKNATGGGKKNPSDFFSYSAVERRRAPNLIGPGRSTTWHRMKST